MHIQETEQDYLEDLVAVVVIHLPMAVQEHKAQAAQRLATDFQAEEAVKRGVVQVAAALAEQVQAQAAYCVIKTHEKVI